MIGKWRGGIVFFELIVYEPIAPADVPTLAKVE